MIEEELWFLKQLQSFIFHPRVIVEWVLMSQKLICLETLWVLSLRDTTEWETLVPMKAWWKSNNKKETQNSVKDIVDMHLLVELQVKPGELVLVDCCPHPRGKLVHLDEPGGDRLVMKRN